jgi:preprotein translocase subunit YajC
MLQTVHATLFAMAQPSGQQPSALVQFLPFVLILGIFYFIILMPMKRRQKKIQEFQGGLKVGDKIVTTSGIYGVVAKMDEKAIQVEVADRVRIKVSRAAVGGYQGQEPVVPESSGS